MHMILGSPPTGGWTVLPVLALVSVLGAACGDSSAGAASTTGSGGASATTTSSTVTGLVGTTTTGTTSTGAGGMGGATSVGTTSTTTGGGTATTATTVGGTGGGTGGTTSAGSSTTGTGTGGAGPMPCATPADCPGVDSACALRTCVAGACGVFDEPAGFLAGPQVSGDCKKAVCDGNGAAVTVVDDTDIPSDGNPCTQDLCTSGQPSNPPAPADSSCGPGGQLFCDGAGSCVGCLADADCGAATACATPSCAGGRCATSYVPAGQGDPGGQTAGDCQRIVCNGGGGTMSVADDTDVPDDGNPCTLDACSAGVPGHTPLPAGTGCGPSLECDGVGGCVGCLVDADCGTNTACATYLCQAGACVTDDTPYGTGDPGGQVQGDCQRIVCNGLGGTTSAPDDTDVPDDGNPCTLDACSGGVASHTPLPAGTSCGAGLVCSGTTCEPGCYIGVTVYAPGAAEPGDACQACDPAASTSAWSPVADGTVCATGATCVSGACTCPGAHDGVSRRRMREPVGRQQQLRHLRQRLRTASGHLHPGVLQQRLLPVPARHVLPAGVLQLAPLRQRQLWVLWPRLQCQRDLLPRHLPVHVAAGYAGGHLQRALLRRGDGPPQLRWVRGAVRGRQDVRVRAVHVTRPLVLAPPFAPTKAGAAPRPSRAPPSGSPRRPRRRGGSGPPPRGRRAAPRGRTRKRTVLASPPRWLPSKARSKPRV